MKLASFTTTERGFTFLEVMTVAFLGSALFLFAVPMLENKNLRSDASALDHQFATHLSQARELAVTGGKTVSVCASYDGKSCSDSTWSKGWLTYFDSENYGVGESIAESDVIGYNPTELRNVAFKVSDESAFKIFRIRFDAHGFNAEQKKLYASLCNDFESDAISGLVTVERTGRIRAIDMSARSGTDKALADKARNDFNFPARCQQAVASL